jgi:hypothetical protein
MKVVRLGVVQGVLGGYQGAFRALFCVINGSSSAEKLTSVSPCLEHGEALLRVLARAREAQDGALLPPVGGHRHGVGQAQTAVGEHGAEALHALMLRAGRRRVVRHGTEAAAASGRR